MRRIANVLSEREAGIVGQCLRAAVEGSFFPDWEFLTLFGVERSTVAEVLASWPEEELDAETVGACVVGALNNLLGYPHGDEKQLRAFVFAQPDEVRLTLHKIVAAGF